MLTGVTCAACGKAFSRDCRACRDRINREARRTPLKLMGGSFQWKLHVPLWDDPEMSSMSCVDCGKQIRQDMPMSELFGPCSAGSQKEVPHA